jgi:hypothetical protein
MSPKELLYIEDALNHVQFLKTQCTDCANQLKDQTLKNFVNDLAQKNTQLFDQIYQTL